MDISARIGNAAKRDGLGLNRKTETKSSVQGLFFKTSSTNDTQMYAADVSTVSSLLTQEQVLKPNKESSVFETRTFFHLGRSNVKRCSFYFNR